MNFNLIHSILTGAERMEWLLNGGCWDYHENNYEMDHSLIPYSEAPVSDIPIDIPH